MTSLEVITARLKRAPDNPSEALNNLLASSKEDIENQVKSARTVLRRCTVFINYSVAKHHFDNICSVLSFVHNTFHQDGWLMAGARELCPFLNDIYCKILAVVDPSQKSKSGVINVALTKRIKANKCALKALRSIFAMCIDFSDIPEDDGRKHLCHFVRLSAAVLLGSGFKPQKSLNDLHYAMDTLVRESSMALSNILMSYPSIVPKAQEMLASRIKDIFVFMGSSPELSIQRSMILTLRALYEHCEKSTTSSEENLSDVIARQLAASKFGTDISLELFKSITLGDDIAKQREKSLVKLLERPNEPHVCFRTPKCTVSIKPDTAKKGKRYTNAEVDWNLNSVVMYPDDENEGKDWPIFHVTHFEWMRDRRELCLRFKDKDDHTGTQVKVIFRKVSITEERKIILEQRIHHIMTRAKEGPPPTLDTVEVTNRKQSKTGPLVGLSSSDFKWKSMKRTDQDKESDGEKAGNPCEAVVLSGGPMMSEMPTPIAIGNACPPGRLLEKRQVNDETTCKQGPGPIHDEGSSSDDSATSNLKPVKKPKNVANKVARGSSLKRQRTDVRQSDKVNKQVDAEVNSFRTGQADLPDMEDGARKGTARHVAEKTALRAMRRNELFEVKPAGHKKRARVNNTKDISAKRRKTFEDFDDGDVSENSSHPASVEKKTRHGRGPSHDRSTIDKMVLEPSPDEQGNMLDFDQAGNDDFMSTETSGAAGSDPSWEPSCGMVTDVTRAKQVGNSNNVAGIRKGTSANVKTTMNMRIVEEEPKDKEDSEDDEMVEEVIGASASHSDDEVCGVDEEEGGVDDKYQGGSDEELVEYDGALQLDESVDDEGLNGKLEDSPDGNCDKNVDSDCDPVDPDKSLGVDKEEEQNDLTGEDDEDEMSGLSGTESPQVRHEDAHALFKPPPVLNDDVDLHRKRIHDGLRVLMKKADGTVNKVSKEIRSNLIKMREEDMEIESEMQAEVRRRVQSLVNRLKEKLSEIRRVKTQELREAKGVVDKISKGLQDVGTKMHVDKRQIGSVTQKTVKDLTLKRDQLAERLDKIVRQAPRLDAKARREVMYNELEKALTRV